MSFISKCLTGWTSPAARKRSPAGLQIETLELRQMLSASGGTHAAAAQVADAKAVPRIDVSGNDYTFGDGIGGMVITQDGLNIHGVITRPESFPNGTFDASFKTDKAKTAKGTGDFILQGDETSTPVIFKIHFKLQSGGGVSFHYHYKVNHHPPG